MQITKEQLSKGQIALTIELSIDEMQPHIGTALDALAKNYDKKGFRKGHVPKEVVRKELGEMALYQAAVEPMVEATLFQALEDEKLEMVGQPQIDIVKLAPNNPFSYKAVISLFPTVVIGDITKSKVEKKSVAIEDKEIEKMLYDLRKMRATEAAVDRVAKKGDKVTLDINMLLDKVPIDGGQSKDATVVLGEQLYVPGLSEKLEGIKKNEERAFLLPFPENYQQKHLSGKDVEFQVRATEVFEISLPKMDNAFAKTLGAESEEGLKEKLRKNLMAEKQQKEDQRFEMALLDEVVGKSTFSDIPDALIHAEAHKMLHELKQNVEQQGAKFPDYLAQIKKTEGELEQDMQPQAEKRVKTSLIARQVYRDQNMEVADEEIEKEITKTKAHYVNNKEVLENLDSENYRQYVKNMLGNRKVIMWLKEKMGK